MDQQIIHRRADQVHRIYDPYPGLTDSEIRVLECKKEIFLMKLFFLFVFPAFIYLDLGLRLGTFNPITMYKFNRAKNIQNNTLWENEVRHNLRFSLLYTQLLKKASSTDENKQQLSVYEYLDMYKRIYSEHDNIDISNLCKVDDKKPFYEKPLHPDILPLPTISQLEQTLKSYE